MFHGTSGQFSSTSTPARRVERLTEACTAREARLCGVLGTLSLEGREVPRDGCRAAELFAKACEGGVALSCEVLRELQQNGPGTSPVGKERPAAQEGRRTSGDAGASPEAASGYWATCA